jgi:hypothetical protein
MENRTAINGTAASSSSHVPMTAITRDDGDLGDS